MTTVAAPIPVPAVAGRPRARYTRVAALGLLLAASAPLTILAASLVAGLPFNQDSIFFVILAAIPLLGAGLVTRFKTFGSIAGMITSILVAFGGFWMAFGITYPTSFADFAPGVALPLGVALGLGGSIAAIVARRRGHVGADATAGERRITLAALGLVGLAVVTSGALNLVTRSSVDAAAAGEAVTATMQDFAFAEETYRIPAGEQASILVRNTDPFVHTFTVPALGIDTTLTPGSEQLVEMNAEPGTYTIYCRPHSDVDEPDPEAAGMASTLVVE